MIVVPVTYDASSLATHATAAAISSGWPKRPSGISSSMACFCSGSSSTNSLIGVTIAPGATLTRRIFLGAGLRDHTHDVLFLADIGLDGHRLRRPGLQCLLDDGLRVTCLLVGVVVHAHTRAFARKALGGRLADAAGGSG